MLDKSQFFWLDVAWRKCLDRHHIPWPLHMKEFGPHGNLKDVNSEERRALFTDITKLIRDNKTFSVASTLSADRYRTVFAGIPNLSMYQACFITLASVITQKRTTRVT